MQIELTNSSSELRKALEQLFKEVQDGLQHGFFECSVICELVKGRKRKLTIKSGKSHLYIIPEDEL